MDYTKVKRVIIPSEFEHKDRHLSEKWKAIFKKYEIRDKPKHRRASVVRRILSQETFRRIAPIIQLEQTFKLREDVHVPSAETVFEQKPEFSSEAETEQALEILSQEEEEEEESLRELDSDLIVNVPSSRSETVLKEEDNPYLKFFKKSTKRAASWRPKDEYIIPPGLGIAGAKDLLTDPNRTLREKANTVTSAIIKDFCDWFRGLGGVKHDTMTEGVLQQLFEIGFDAPAAKSLCVRTKELPVVTEQVAASRNLPQSSIRAGLHRTINSDMRAERKKTRTVAFGKTLRRPLRYQPPQNNTKKKWVDCPNIPQDLVTHEVVWKDITTLRSTRSFCEYLKTNPHIQPPQYLCQLEMIPT